MLDRLSPEKFVGARIQSYLVEQLVEQSELGALYTARDSVRGAPYVLAILSIPLGTADAGYPNAPHDSAAASFASRPASNSGPPCRRHKNSRFASIVSRLQARANVKLTRARSFFTRPAWAAGKERKWAPKISDSSYVECSVEES